MREIYGDIFDENYLGRRGDKGSLVLTGSDWSAGRRATGRAHGYRFVNLDQENRTKEEWPYSYTDHYLCGERTNGSSAVYSDRLHQWDKMASERASKAVSGEKAHFGHWGLAAATRYLSAYFNKPVKAVAVAEGCNVGNGYPYWIFWYEEAPSDPTTPLADGVSVSSHDDKIGGA